MATDDQKPADEKSGTSRTWLVINGVCGKLAVSTKATKENILELLRQGGVLEVNDAYEFHSNTALEPVTMPGGQVGQRVGKQHLMVRVDAILLQTLSYVSLAGASIYFLDDLKEGDQAVYKDMLQKAVRFADEWLKHRLAQSAGIVAATSMPNVPPPGGRG